MRHKYGRVVSKDKKIYHDSWCPYAKNIKSDNKWQTSNFRELRKQGYKPCSFCQRPPGIAYYYRTIEKLDCMFDKFSNSICVKTNIGFWKAVYGKEDRLWRLYHMNSFGRDHFDPDLNPKELVKGRFHRQKDVAPQESFETVLNYILAHDKNKRIIQDDYRKLPKSSKQDRKYYYAAKNRKKRHDINKVFKLFDKIKMEGESIRNGRNDENLHAEKGGKTKGGQRL